MRPSVTYEVIDVKTELKEDLSNEPQADDRRHGAYKSNELCKKDENRPAFRMAVFDAFIKAHG
jgi:hypothetical protein